MDCRETDFCCNSQKSCREAKTDGKVSLLNEIMWRLRTMRTDEDSRMVASALLAPHIAACGLSDHDAAVLVTFLAERVKTGPDFEEVRWSDSIDRPDLRWT